MKFWVILICLMRSKIEKEVEVIDKKIMKLALNPFAESLAQCQKIADLSNEKISYINLKILYDRIWKEIGDEGVQKIDLLSSKTSLKRYCEKEGLSMKQIAEEALSFAKKAVPALEKLSFNPQRMDEDFGGLCRIAYELHRVRGIIKYACVSNKEKIGIAS